MPNLNAQIIMRRGTRPALLVLAVICALVSLISDRAAFWLADLGRTAAARFGFRVEIR